MCVRTKFSYGCGHTFRNTEGCNSPDCSGLDKYLITKEGDCKSCKRDGINSTRGRDGLGRYAKEIRRQRERSQSTSFEPGSGVVSTESVARHSATESVHDSDGISPWAVPLARERPWESPHRRKADDAWLSEHESRISDLQDRLQNVHVSQDHELLETSRRHLYDFDDETEKDEPQREITNEYHASEDEMCTVEDLPTTPRYTIEVRRRMENTPSQHSRSRSGRSYRPEILQYSHDSLPDSMPSYRSSPRYKAQSTIRYTHPDQNYEYDYYTGKSAPRTLAQRSSGRAKTEPYSPHSRSNSGYGYDYEHAHPVVHDSLYSYGSPKYQLPQRSSTYRYRPQELSPMAMSYTRYQPRY